MRILLLLLLLSFSLSTTSYHLSRIVTDLSTLSRITNAIALTNAAHQQNLDVHVVICELIQVGPDAFKTLMSANITEILIPVSEVFGKINGLGKQWNQANKEDREVLETVMEALKGLKEDFKGYGFDEREVSIEKFHSTIKSQNASSPPLIPEFCPKDIFEIIANLDLSLNKNQEFSEDTKKRFLLDFQAKSSSLLDCIERVKKYPEEAQTDPFLHQVGTLAKLERLGEHLKNWNLKVQEVLVKVPKALEKIQKDLDASKSLRNSEKVGEKVWNLTDQHGKLSLAEVPLTLTKGFPRGTMDLLQVAHDLQDPWFLRTIAKGPQALKGTQNLQRALGNFYLAAKAFDNVNWLLKGFFEMNSEDVGDTMKVLMKTERFYDTKDLRGNQGFQECLDKNPAGTGDITFLESFFKALQDPYISVDALTTVANRCLRVQDKSPGIKKVITDVSDAITSGKPISEVPGFKKFLEVISELDEVAKARSSALEHFKKLKDDPTFQLAPLNITKTLQDSKMIEFFRCLNSTTFNFEAPLNTAKFLESLRDLQTRQASGGLENTKKYLKTAQRFQSAVSQINNMVHYLAEEAKKRKVPTVIQKFNESQSIVTHLAEGVKVLSNMAEALEGQQVIKDSMKYPKEVQQQIKSMSSKEHKEFWKNAPRQIEDMIKELRTLDAFAQKIQNQSIQTIKQIFSEAQKVHGILKYHDIFPEIPKMLTSDLFYPDPKFQWAIENAEELSQLDLDFVKHGTNLQSGDLSLQELIKYFEDIFPVPVQNSLYHSPINPTISVWAVVGMCFGFFALCILLGFVVYGFTKNGRRKYRNLWLYYFPNQEEFERRWRYSLFMDRENGQNALLDASRDVNPKNLKRILAQGAYVNVYSVLGNTPLHVATKLGLSKIVELLIKNGADQTLLNGQNKTPEQMIPENYKEYMKEDAPKYKKIERIYKKYKDKTYRIQVPQVFPTHLFHIFVESRTEIKLMTAFFEKYKGITSDEPLPTTTHCICKTSANGILETDDVDLLQWIFTGAIIVKESWMTDCLENEKLIRKDAQYLVEHVKYHGTLYENCVLPWSRAQAKGEMPYLLGAFVVFVVKECPKIPTYHLLITTLGGVFLKEFPKKEHYNPGSHPYLHTNLGPLWIIHDGKTDLTAYQNDPDRMFSLFTEEEFVSFLLRRDMQKETNMNPISQVSTKYEED